MKKTFALSALLFFAFFAATFAGATLEVFLTAAFAADNSGEREFVFFVDNVENRPAGSFEAGDIILEMNGVSLEGFTDLKKLSEKLFNAFESGDISAVVFRNGKKISVSEKNFNDQSKSISYNVLKKVPRYIDKNSLKADIESLIPRIAETYVKYDSKKFAAAEQSFAAKLPAMLIGDKIPYTTAARTLLKFGALYGDGHFGLLASEIASDALYELVAGCVPLFPLNVEVRRGVIYITRDGRKYKLKKINGEDIESVANKIKEMIPNESEGFVDNEIETQFWFFYYLINGGCVKFKITAADAGGETSFEVPGVSYSMIMRERKANLKDYEFRIIDDTGIISVNTFNFSDYSEYNYKNFLKKTFKKIREKKIAKLLIDIRKNNGGNTDYAVDLLLYLSDKPAVFWEATVLKCSRTAQDSGYTFEKGMKPGDIKKYEWYGGAGGANKNELEYNGRSVLLIGKNCFSTSLDFAVAFKKMGIGKTVGENTGGTRKSTDRSVRVELPSIGLKFCIPAKYYISADAGFDNDGTLAPDVLVAPDGKEFSAGDEMLKFALDQLK
ncbi:MAG TPA: S41 family peptidase [Candidatus Wallbacteria bacterium]|nr:S41 family peptidase [Candidatus Wallbacteria bacterium]